MSSRSHAGRVAVTGIGMITPLGVTTAECWQNMLAGKSGITRITRFDTGTCLTRIAGQLPDRYFELEKGALSPRVFKRSVLGTRLAALSARQALEDAKIDVEEIKGSGVGVISGSGGSAFGDETICMGLPKKKPIFSHEMLNALSACISIDMKLKGPSFNVATACASGAFAVALAFEYVKRTRQPCLAVGVDTVVHKDIIKGFSKLMALSERNDEPEKASRPFDRMRDGFVLSDGACTIVLEPYEQAVRREARIYAFVSGAALNSEAFNIVAPEPEGREMARTMELAIMRSGVPKERIGYVSAHGTATLHNDIAETKAIKHVFGPGAYGIPVSSQKSMLGHSIGAAGAIEVAVTSLTLYHQKITPTINYEEKDPECDLDYVPNQPRDVSGLEAAITNSFGFGGHNATIVLQRNPTDA